MMTERALMTQGHGRARAVLAHVLPAIALMTAFLAWPASTLIGAGAQSGTMAAKAGRRSNAEMPAASSHDTRPPLPTLAPAGWPVSQRLTPVQCRNRRVALTCWFTLNGGSVCVLLGLRITQCDAGTR